MSNHQGFFIFFFLGNIYDEVFISFPFPVEYITIEQLPSRIGPESLLVYPTDTIYGLGGFVTPTAVEKISQYKQRPGSKHYSIIAPHFSRIQDYFLVTPQFAKEWVSRQERFPNRGLTLLLPLAPQRPKDIDFSLLSKTETIGVRILNHPIQSIIQNIGQPIITTSANLSGQPPIKSLKELTEIQKKHIDIGIDGGTLDNSASVTIDYLSETVVRE